METTDLNNKKLKAVLALSDGTVFTGAGFGAEKTVSGEIVFNTSFVGYEESLTDPSYKGQILVSTYPLIGNYGVNKANLESSRVQAEGFVIRELSQFYKHRDSNISLGTFLKQNRVPGIEGIDTRLITKIVRTEGVMNAVLAVSQRPINESKVLKQAQSAANYASLELLRKVSVKARKRIGIGAGKTIAIIDTGIKKSIISNFTKRNVNVVLMPYNAKPQDILKLNVDGLFLANGPGNPEMATDAIACVRELHAKMPISGICLGHQIVGLALGAKTYKLKFGHRGVNQPVKNIIDNKVHITSQNHGFAIDAQSLAGTGLEVTYINLNDGSVEGMRHAKLPIRTVQMHPEANPGPRDVEFIFDEFVRDIDSPLPLRERVRVRGN
ncbi:glutamine-hydrolyzing carbamoyl-phosphate synthase small subunit [Elusimicrobiota bacterium]